MRNQYNIKLEDVVTFNNYFRALKECNKAVSYKYSVQEYDSNCVLYITDTINSILQGEIPAVKDIKHIVIYERGKRRVITPIYIGDRITQKVLCDNVLIPSICPHLIFDNGASMKGKGTSFARKRINCFIEKAKREYKMGEFYVLTFDFKNFFDSIPHEQCYRVLKKYLSDERLVDLTIGIIESYKLCNIRTIGAPDKRKEALKQLLEHKGKGICLGSQISQIMAVAIPNDFDHFVKDKLRIKYYERYMDDGVIILDDKKQVQEIKEILSVVAQKYGLTFNVKKTRVVKISKGFTFLKVKYRVSDNQTIKQLAKSGIVRERRKLKRFRAKVKGGDMSLKDVYNNIQSWNAHSKIAKCNTTVKNIFGLYDKDYGGYKLTRKYYSEHPHEKRNKKTVRV